MSNLESQLSLAAADPLGEDAARLTLAMRAEVFSRYSDVLVEASETSPVNDPPGPRSTFLIARLRGEPVACAALRPMDDNAAEVRRMYVDPAVRRQGIARLLLSALEQAAAQFGYDTLRLETGVRQPEAIALYDSAGFYRISPYGCHIGDPLSLCFEKRVIPDGTLQDLTGI